MQIPAFRNPLFKAFYSQAGEGKEELMRGAQEISKVRK